SPILSFFFNDLAPTEIYTLSLHDALPISTEGPVCAACWGSILPLTPPLCEICGDPLPSWRIATLAFARCARCRRLSRAIDRERRSEEHTSELQSRGHLVCRLLLEKKKNTK